MIYMSCSNIADAIIDSDKLFLIAFEVPFLRVRCAAFLCRVLVAVRFSLGVLPSSFVQSVRTCDAASDAVALDRIA